MADVITTLHPEGAPNDNLYPNVKDENIPSSIERKGDLLWENADPTSSFSNQNVSISDTSEYRYLSILVKRNTSSASADQEFKMKRERSKICFTIFADDGPSSTIITNRSILLVSDTQVTFYKGFLNNVENNDVNIPVAIYGIK